MPTQSIPRPKRRLAEAEISAWEAFLRAYAAMTRALEREDASRRGLSLGEHFLLVDIARGPDIGSRPTDLAAHSLLTKSGLTRAMERLEEHGLIERRTCPTDGRVSYAAITPKGRHLLRRAAPSHIRAIARYFAEPLNAHEVEVLTSALQKVSAAAPQA